MVGKRNRIHLFPDERDKKSGGSGDAASGKSDIESGDRQPRQKPGVWRFKDAARTALADERRRQLKEKLLQGIDREGLQKQKKSDDEVRWLHTSNMP